MPSPFLPSSPNNRHRRRRWPLFALLGLLLVAGVAVAAYFAFVKKQGNAYNAKAPIESQAPPPKPKRAETFKWPFYGYTPERTRALDAKLRPPYKQLWQFGRGSLIEFQPVLANGYLYLVENSGSAFSINAKTGHVLWQRKVGSLSAASPAWYNDRVYIVPLSQDVWCLAARTGHTIWHKPLPSRSESSPLVMNGEIGRAHV